MSKPIGELKRVNLREIEIWEKETGFSKWLAKPENLSLLGDELGIEISIDKDKIETEAAAGRFRIDILVEKPEGKNIIIENQLEATDHDHLGKLITYAAKRKASKIIWVFKTIEEEHQTAIDWLNNNTHDEVQFFAVKIEAWKINWGKDSEIKKSPAAPRFQIIRKPSNWDEQTGKTEIRKQKQSDFWMSLKKFAEKEGKKDVIFPTKKDPRTGRWYDIEIGRKDAWIALGVEATGDNEIVCRFHIDRNEGLYEYLEKQKQEIEKEIESDLKWNGYRVSFTISQYEKDFDLDDESKRDEYFDWLIERASAFHKVFSERLKDYGE